MTQAQTISKKRIADHGEVFTNSREINAMLDLVKQECERIEATFLEPACGTGNFLVEILARKLAVVAQRYSKSQFEFERYAVLAVCSIYGIDLLPDNVAACKTRLYNLFSNHYTTHFGTACKSDCHASVRYVLDQNIIHGDALELKTVDLLGSTANSPPIVFAEWKAINGAMIKRRDFVFENLVLKSSERELPLFSDQGDDAYIPEPIKDYQPVHFLALSEFK